MPDPTPWLETVGRDRPEPAAVVLVAHGGKAHSTASAHRRGLAHRRMLPFARSLERAGRSYRTGLGSGVAVYVLRYRFKGWNGPATDAYRDAAWAVAEIARRHPDRPIVLVGHSLGGRAVLRAADGPGVVAVCALAPWLDGTDPVAQLADRAVLVAHGDRDRMTDPAASYEFALRARATTARVARFEVLGDGHAMLRRPREWHALVRRFVLGEIGTEPLDRSITNAVREPAPAGLRVALGAGEHPGPDGSREQKE